MKYKNDANCPMFVGLPKENAAILDFYFKDCCFDTHNNYRRKRASPCFYSQREKNEERPLKSWHSVVSSSGSCSINSYKPYDMYCRSVQESDAESACQSGYHEDTEIYHEDNDQSFTEDTLADEIHRQELNAYRSTIEALHASGPLTWEKETMGQSTGLYTLLMHQLVDVGTMWEIQEQIAQPANDPKLTLAVGMGWVTSQTELKRIRSVTDQGSMLLTNSNNWNSEIQAGYNRISLEADKEIINGCSGHYSCCGMLAEGHFGVPQVQNLIERCLQLYVNKDEVVKSLLNRARIDPGFTALGTNATRASTSESGSRIMISREAFE
ncbi:EMSY domain-containing protein [Tanacetum coccineum]